MGNEADTVTPLDGDGHSVVGGAFQPFDEGTGNIKDEYFETKGRTTVATRPGFVFSPSDKGIPVITSSGVQMTKEQADAVVAEAESTRAGVRIVGNDDDKNTEE